MMNQSFHPLLDLLPEVQDALKNGKPVVALESTIIAHGMPYPRNVKTALTVEKIIRQTGAIPATIAVLDGKLKVGLTHDVVDLLGRKGQAVIKCSRRDLPFVLQSKQAGATTVAATMIVAAMAGIRIFATGGIGGVHRNGTETMDISADLQELARTSVAVVCAGAKSILDLGLTLEHLETHGVPVIGFQTDDFPSFYTRTSHFKVDYNVKALSDLAEALHLKWSLGLQGGVVVANPVPAEFAMEENLITQAIALAIKEAEDQQIRGKAITPFLLARIEQITEGASLDSNIQLVYHNAKVAAELAIAFSRQV